MRATFAFDIKDSELISMNFEQAETHRDEGLSSSSVHILMSTLFSRFRYSIFCVHLKNSNAHPMSNSNRDAIQSLRWHFPTSNRKCTTIEGQMHHFQFR